MDGLADKCDSWILDRCVGNTGGIPRLGFEGLCMQDSPLGIRFSRFHDAECCPELRILTVDS